MGGARGEEEEEGEESECWEGGHGWECGGAGVTFGDITHESHQMQKVYVRGVKWHVQGVKA